MTTKKRTHGNWNPDQGKTMFLAGATYRKQPESARIAALRVGNDDPLIATMIKSADVARRSINKLYSFWDFSPNTFQEDLDAEIATYQNVFLDSGVFGMAMEYAKKYNISHNVALTTPLDAIPTWPAFRDRYIAMMRHVQDSVWGYVELDLGGTQQKIQTRTWLESIGLKPIPVWHPLNDGLDYGKFLMTTYDRICVGNVVKSDAQTRKVILQAMTLAKTEGVWVHALGLGPMDFVTAYNVDSIDSTTWMTSMMYSRAFVYGLMNAFTREGRYYETDVSGINRVTAFSMLERQAASMEKNWRNYEQSKRGLYGSDSDIL